VFEAPHEALEGTPLDGRSNGAAGYSVVVTTTAGRTYGGYVEVIADGDDARLYWCSVDL
jgi:hypothetical protein